MQKLPNPFLNSVPIEKPAQLTLHTSTKEPVVKTSKQFHKNNDRVKNNTDYKKKSNYSVFYSNRYNTQHKHFQSKQSDNELPGQRSGQHRSSGQNYNKQNKHRFTVNQEHQQQNENTRNQTQYDNFKYYRQDNRRKSNLWCEVCDRSFFTIDQLTQHISEHQKCGIDGCKFEGHELMVTKHIQMQHSSGLYDKIKALNSQEEIMKWREERRKRYPTKENIELRRQEQLEKEKRGERLHDPKNRFGHKNDKRSAVHNKINSYNDKNNFEHNIKNNNRKRKRNRKVKGRSNGNDVTEAAEDKSDDEMIGTLKKFKGSMQQIDYKRIKKNNETSQNVLSKFLGMYGDDSDDDTDTENTSITEEIIENCGSLSSIVQSPLNENIIMDDKNTIIESDNESSKQIIDTNNNNSLECNEDDMTDIAVDDLPDEQPIISSKKDEIHDKKIDEQQNNVLDNNKKNDQNKSKKQLNKNKNTNEVIKPTDKKQTTLLDLSKRYRNQNTMLEKLLQKEIRHERNVLLQCIRYVVEHNFFDVAKEK